MTRAARIRATLTDIFQPTRLEVIDDSAKHHGHAGARPEGETHYTVRIASAKLTGLSRVAAHRAVYAALDAEFKGGLHALAVEVVL